MKSKILIIGSGGFIGQHAARYFSSAGYKVTGCDIMASAEAGYIHIDAADFDFNPLFSEQEFDYCINAAGSAHVAYSFLHPEKDFELNVSLVIRLLGAIKNNCPDCKFINFSSAAVYGNPSVLPVPEDADTRPLSPYGYHKLLSEKLLLEYNRFFGLKTCSLRVFSVYGESLKKQLFWDLYLKSLQAVPSGSVCLYGTGNESRDFIYIGDLVSILEKIMTAAVFEGEVYNVGNGEEVYIRDAAALFYKELGWRGNIVFSGEEKTGDPVNWKADIKKIESMGYVRTYSFEQGIKNYTAWLKKLK